MTCVMADGGRIGLYAGNSLPDGGWSFTFIVFGTAAWKTKFVTAEDKELILETTTINMSLLDSSALVFAK